MKNNKIFYHWAKEYYADSGFNSSVYHDFVRDMERDRSFPWLHAKDKRSLRKYKKEIIEYLKKKNACNEAIDAFETLFKDYTEQYLGRVL